MPSILSRFFSAYLNADYDPSGATKNADDDRFSIIGHDAVKQVTVSRAHEMMHSSYASLFLCLKQVSHLFVESSLFGENSSTSSLNIMTISAVLFVIAIFHMNRKKRSCAKTPWPKVPGVRPFLGNDLGDLDYFVDTMEKWASLYGKEGVFEANVFGNKFFVLCNEEKAAILESKRPFQVTRREKINEAINSVYGEGLFSAEGEDWKKDRRIVGPVYNHKNVKDHHHKILKLVASRLIEKWSSFVEEDKAIAINDDFLSCTMDVISLVAFAKDLNSLNKVDAELGESLRTYMQKLYPRFLSPVRYWRIPVIGQYLDGAGWVADRMKRHCLAYIDEFEILSNTNQHSVEYENMSKSFLGKVVLMNKKSEEALSTKRLVGNLLTTFIAGADTTSVTLCSCLYEIAADKTGLQNELAQEALAIKNFETSDLDTIIDSIPRMKSLFYEVIRLRGPSPYNGYTSQVPIDFNGTILPSKSNFLILKRYISTLDSGDPATTTPRGPRDSPLNEFCARRWLKVDDTVHKRVQQIIKPSYKSGFRGFGTGMRLCPGKDLAEAETLVFLVSILRNFEVSLEVGHPPMQLVTRFTQTQGNDVKIVCQKRRKV
jgi:cytochrome P450